MNPNNCLDFEKPIAELEAMLKELRHLLQHLDALAVDELLEQRYQRITKRQQSYGAKNLLRN